ncbi:unnamed protein product [Rotaria sp. Silwood2]|nr:unnamed protein product [Rotaria sp. Silwood2]CAF2612705.1 unnamed protein product [Rotaria sp. Silwood2]CAF2873932.1 unnamed protein product [Rotaria sp. Silwood2]CAF3437960.1 unnamed protein product [Rotaria sp. Silwood2]CAF4073894.1 unnamed protein product [Rotaria sp. Silwood2]
MQSNVTTSLSTKSDSYFFTEKCIQRDLEKIKINIQDSPIIFIDPIDDNYSHLEAAITGPMSTPYENGTFLLHLKISEEYPYKPPQSITFKRATMHPNIDEYGNFMSELFNLESWSPAMTIKSILEHVWARLAIPNIDSNECDPTRAQLYRTDKHQFELIAREYSIKYANAT